MRTCFVKKCSLLRRLNNFHEDVNEYSSNKHLFKAPKDPATLSQWKNCVGDTLTSDHFLCSLHFEDKFIMKTFKYVINGKDIFEPRRRWSLTSDAIPLSLKEMKVDEDTKSFKASDALSFPASTSKSLCTIIVPNGSQKQKTAASSSRLTYSKASHINALIGTVSISSENGNNPWKRQCTSNTKGSSNKTTQCSFQTFLSSNILVEPSKVEKLDRSKIDKKLIGSLRTRLKNKSALVAQLRKKIKLLEEEKYSLKKEKFEIEQLPQKQKDILKEALNNVRRKAPRGNRYSKEWIMDCQVLHVQSPETYEFLRLKKYLPLPCSQSLNRNLKNLDNDDCETDNTEPL